MNSGTSCFIGILSMATLHILSMNNIGNELILRKLFVLVHYCCQIAPFEVDFERKILFVIRKKNSDFVFDKIKFKKIRVLYLTV